ncbi:hypothetical protein NC652_038534 [Populus alba x Populus x berolinensis]|nr:hypothetical protein NC652_038534 [Populus alba x Populus x berolinensis]
MESMLIPVCEKHGEKHCHQTFKLSSNKLFVYHIEKLIQHCTSRGVSSLRLKSLTEPFPGRVEGRLPVDFLLIPFPFLGPSGQLDLELTNHYTVT